MKSQHIDICKLFLQEATLNHAHKLARIWKIVHIILIILAGIQCIFQFNFTLLVGLVIQGSFLWIVWNFVFELETAITRISESQPVGYSV